KILALPAATMLIGVATFATGLKRLSGSTQTAGPDDSIRGSPRFSDARRRVIERNSPVISVWGKQPLLLRILSVAIFGALLFYSPPDALGLQSAAAMAMLVITLRELVRIHRATRPVVSRHILGVLGMGLGVALYIDRLSCAILLAGLLIA